MTNPSVLPTQGQQDRETPSEFFDIVNRRWPICFDLAASYENKKHLSFFGQQRNGSFDDALTKDWALLSNLTNSHEKKYLWLNPPFGKTKKFMKKCMQERKRGARIVTLTLASLGSNWFRDCVKDHAMVWILQGRLTFEGCTAPFPKELILSVWENGRTGIGFYDWRLDK